MEPEADFPAAHSMDTTWYAVDRDGHIAVFDSGEAGAVPEHAATDQSIELIERLAEAMPLELPVPEVDGPRALGTVSEECHQAMDAPEVEHLFEAMGTPAAKGFLLFLDSIELLEGEAESLGLEVLRARVGHAILVRPYGQLPRNLIERLHAAGHCLGCFRLADHGGMNSVLGLFSYDHSCENWISGPYDREGQPKHPLRSDQLPSELREAVERMRFDALCFAETREIQPVDHAPCDSWEYAYLGLDRRTVRAFPGREAEFREAYEDPEDRSPRLNIVMPPGPPPDETGRARPGTETSS